MFNSLFFVPRVDFQIRCGNIADLAAYFRLRHLPSAIWMAVAPIDQMSTAVVYCWLPYIYGTVNEGVPTEELQYGRCRANLNQDSNGRLILPT